MTLTDPIVKARQHAEKPGGRPKSQFPVPNNAVVRDAKGKNCWKFFDYWKKLTADMATVAEIRVYRCWPVINLKLVEPDRRNIVFEFLEGECPIADPYTYDQWFLDRYGAGDWKVVITEKGVYGQIMTALFAARGLGGGEDLDGYPPKLDYRTVVDCEQNRTFIDWARRNGKQLPWEDQEQEGNDFMSSTVTSAGVPAQASPQQSAIGEVFKSMAQAHTDMAKAAIEGAKDSAEIRVRLAETRGPDPQSVATSEAIKLITGTADRMVKMVTDNAGKQYDPMDVLDRAAKYFQAPKGGDGAAAGENGMMTMVLNAINSSNDRVLKIYEDQNKVMRDLVLQRNPDGSHGPGIEKKSFVDQAQEYKQIAELFGWARNAGNAVSTQVAEPPAPAGPSWFNETTAPIIIMGFQTCMVLVANIVHNYAATKIKGMEPQSPAQAVAEATRMMAQANGGQPAAAAATETPEEKKARYHKLWQNFIVQIEKPFLEHFFVQSAKGYTLAAFVMTDGTMREVTENGRANYVAVRNLGVAQFKVYLAGHDPIWSKIQGMPQAVDRFLGEFMDYDRWATQEAERMRRQASGANGHAAGPPAAATSQETQPEGD